MINITMSFNLKASIHEIYDEYICLYVEEGTILYPIEITPKKLNINDKVHMHPENFIKKGRSLKSSLRNEYNRKVLLPYKISLNNEYCIGNEKFIIKEPMEENIITDILYLFGKVKNINNQGCFIEIEKAEIIIDKKHFNEGFKDGDYYIVKNDELCFDEETTKSTLSSLEILEGYISNDFVD